MHTQTSFILEKTPWRCINSLNDQCSRFGRQLDISLVQNLHWCEISVWNCVEYSQLVGDYALFCLNYSGNNLNHSTSAVHVSPGGCCMWVRTAFISKLAYIPPPPLRNHKVKQQRIRYRNIINNYNFNLSIFINNPHTLISMIRVRSNILLDISERQRPCTSLNYFIKSAAVLAYLLCKHCSRLMQVNFLLAFWYHMWSRDQSIFQWTHSNNNQTVRQSQVVFCLFI